MSISWKSESHNFVYVLRKDICLLIDNFVLFLQAENENEGSFEDHIEKFTQDLDQCLVRTRCLPANDETLAVECALLHNLMYAVSVKEMCCPNLQFKSFIELCTVHILHTLKKVKNFVGGSEEAVLAVPDVGFLEDSTDAFSSNWALSRQELVFILSDVFTFLKNLDYVELRQSIGLLACLWSLVLYGKDPQWSVPDLSLFMDESFCGKSVVVEIKQGFLYLTSYSSLINEPHVKKQCEASEDSSSVLCGLTALLLAANSLHNGNMSQCLVFTSKIKATDGKWTNYSGILKAKAMIGSGHFLEPIQDLHLALQHGAKTSPFVTLQMYLLLASCYATQGLPHLSIAVLQRCLEINPGCTAALYMLVQQFSVLRKEQAEMDCVKALVKASEKTAMAGQTLEEAFQLEKLVERVVAPESKVTQSQALYLQASRCEQLGYFLESSQAYLKLIQVYEKVDSPHASLAWLPAPIEVPDLLTLCRYAARALLAVPLYSRCLQFCDKVLGAIAASSASSSPTTFHVFDMSLLSFAESLSLSGTFTENMKADTSQSEGGLRKRRFSSTDMEKVEDIDQVSDWYHEENVILLLMCKAQTFVVDGEVQSSINVLNRAFERLLECRHVGQGHGSKEMSGQPSLSLTSHSKRPCYSLDQDKNEKGAPYAVQTSNEDKKWDELAAQLCVYLADAKYRCKNYRESLYFARLAVQLQTEMEKALYFVCRSRLALGHDNEAGGPWLHHRELPRNKSSVHLEHGLQQRIEMLRSIPNDTEHLESNCLLGTLSKKMKIQLDVDCLQSLKDIK